MKAFEYFSPATLEAAVKDLAGPRDRRGALPAAPT